MNKRLLLLYFVISAICCFSLSCNKDDETNIQLTVLPGDLYLYNQAGDIRTFDITVKSDVNISKFTIIANFPTTKPLILLDTGLFGKNIHFKYFYAVTNAQEVTLEFTAIDENGNSSGALRNISVFSLLPESTGHKMFSLFSAKQCAFDLINGEPLFLSADSSLRDIQDNSIDTTSTKSLSKIWISPSKCSFVRFNGFDYPNATNLSAEQAYNSGLKSNEIHDILKDDIIIVKVTRINSAPKYVVIKIIEVSDAQGVKNDYYLFNLKK
jgi:hypothetical protein